MSASREKKIRQSNAGQELTEKQIKAQQEAAQARRNSIVYTVLGVVSVVLVAALLIWNSGFFQNRAKALTIGDETYTAADVQYYYNQVYSRYYTYAQYGMVSGFDVHTHPADQMYDEAAGLTWHDQILDEAITAMAEVESLVAQAESEGYELSEEGKHTVEHTLEDLLTASATNGYSTVNSYLKAVYGSSMTKGRYEQVLRDSVLAGEFQDQYVSTLTYTDEELEKYYTENADALDLYDYHYAYFSGSADATKDADGKTVQPTDEQKDAAMRAALDKAEAVQAALENGTDFDDAMAVYTEDTKVSSYPEQSTAGSSLSTLYAEWMQADGRRAGDVTMLPNAEGTGYYVVEYLGRGRNPEVAADVRHILVAAEQDEGADGPTDAQYEAAKAEAEALLQQWKSGAATEDSFAELAKAESADPGSAENGGLYTQVSSQTGFIADFTNWVTDPARQAGDTGLVKNTESATKGWHIMYYVGANEPVWKTEARSTLTSQATMEWVDKLVEAQNITELDGLKHVK